MDISYTLHEVSMNAITTSDTLDISNHISINTPELILVKDRKDLPPVFSEKALKFPEETATQSLLLVKDRQDLPPVLKLPEGTDTQSLLLVKDPKDLPPVLKLPEGTATQSLLLASGNIDKQKSITKLAEDCSLGQYNNLNIPLGSRSPIHIKEIMDHNSMTLDEDNINELYRFNCQRSLTIALNDSKNHLSVFIDHGSKLPEATPLSADITSLPLSNQLSINDQTFSLNQSDIIDIAQNDLESIHDSDTDNEVGVVSKLEPNIHCPSSVGSIHKLKGQNDPSVLSSKQAELVTMTKSSKDRPYKYLGDYTLFPEQSMMRTSFSSRSPHIITVTQPELQNDTKKDIENLATPILVSSPTEEYLQDSTLIIGTDNQDLVTFPALKCDKVASIAVNNPKYPPSLFPESALKLPEEASFLLVKDPKDLPPGQPKGVLVKDSRFPTKEGKNSSWEFPIPISNFREYHENSNYNIHSMYVSKVKNEAYCRNTTIPFTNRDNISPSERSIESFTESFQDSKLSNINIPKGIFMSDNTKGLSMTDETTLYLRKRRIVLDTPFSTRSTISYGFIVYAKDTNRWAIIQRKHSVEFLLFIRGLYRLTYLPLILSCITQDESSVIYRCLKCGPEVFKTIYLEELELSPDGLEYALIRMAESRNVVLNLLPKLDLTNNNLSWTWPKGRLHISSNRETPFECAKREFTEEVEIILPPPIFISDTYVSENIKTITGRNIESRYWIYVISNEIPMEPPQSHPEVSNRIWANTDQCRKLVRHENLFQQVINMISTIN